MSIICKPFVFVRHGETPLNREKLIGGSTDVP
ncbi:TPA: histidine phosphatase family protein, partial [Enterobacter kobei]|nr:histidine phosphatase family protein [Enterobacter kobei]